MRLLSSIDKSEIRISSPITNGRHNLEQNVNNNDKIDTNHLNETNDKMKQINNDEIDDDNDSYTDTLSYNECDITLVGDDNLNCVPKNEAEMMFMQVVEILRFEQEVSLLHFNCIRPFDIG